MRLAQLARKIGKTQNEIVEVLKDKGHDVNENGNSKLSDEAIMVIHDHFGIVEVEAEPEAEDTEDDVVVVNEESNESLVDNTDRKHEPTDEIEERSDVENDNIELPPANNEVENETHSEETKEAEREIIRAKKVKLDGIKVLGKIELPEPKEKEASETNETKNEERTSKKAARKSKRHIKGRKKISFTEKVKREEEKAAREKKKKEKRIKEKKKQHYFKNVQPKVAPKPKKKTATKKVRSTTPKRVKLQYKNPIRKFWAWLNGEYDV